MEISLEVASMGSVISSSIIYGGYYFSIYALIPIGSILFTISILYLLINAPEIYIKRQSKARTGNLEKWTEE